MKSFTDHSGYKVNITFNSAVFSEPSDVLIFPLYNEGIILTNHKERGIELPGGKIKNNESAIDAAVREVYEECGASLSSIQLIGQYSIPDFNASGLVKSIFVAKVSELNAIKQTTDTYGPVIFETLPTTADLMREDFSPYIKDEVYPLTINHIRSTKKLNSYLKLIHI
ncbi:NUDIX domain-containing protein [Lottiidibacillus patelloidae]|uniref:NUDIX domain-containing protein n=1 Tax=Lottiidibacillus patelloidae TaxID=2670334 RepID=UPI001303511A|nr:NUDIX domain-containing protein [Lottiidibacillus patelloidae]